MMSEEIKSESEKKKEDWMNSKWRPMMGWLYMAVCAFDFVLFPILWSMVQAIMHHPQMTQWQPLTLQGAGLFHIAMGAVLGIAALGRTQEKLQGANNGGLQPSGFGVSSPAPSNFGAPTAPSFGAPSTPSSFGGSSFGSPSPMVPRSTTVTTTFGAPASPVMSRSGKLGPAEEPMPEL